MTRTYEELVRLRQDNRIGWLQFTLESEHADDYMQWCRECTLSNKSAQLQI